MLLIAGRPWAISVDECVCVCVGFPLMSQANGQVTSQRRPLYIHRVPGVGVLPSLVI